MSEKDTGTSTCTSTNLNKSLKRAVGGGLSGAGAMVMQVSSLMWLRTTMNYQYRYGTTTKDAMKHLYKEGGVRRFYRGYLPALTIGPMARFGDTAANTYVMDAFANKNVPTSVSTVVGSAAAASWRVFLMPLDALKTSLQVEGKNGIALLRNKATREGGKVLYHGSMASMSATFVGHYPWYLTFNVLDNKLPKYNETYKNLLRSAFIGFNASLISDTVSNSLRVIKTTKQTFPGSISYVDTVKHVIKEDNISGLFGRGVKTRIMTNALQGMLFTVCWTLLKDNFKI